MSDVSSRALDRRQLIKAGAWAAPVIVLATAAPAAAAAQSVGATYSGAAVVSNTLSLHNDSVAGQGTVTVAFRYDRNAFPEGHSVGGDWKTLDAPSLLSIAWTVVAIGPESSTKETTVASGTAQAKIQGKSDDQTTIFSLPAGSYKFQFRFTSATFTPNPVKQADGSQATFANTSQNPIQSGALVIT